MRTKRSPREGQNNDANERNHNIPPHFLLGKGHRSSASEVQRDENQKTRGAGRGTGPVQKRNQRRIISVLACDSPCLKIWCASSISVAPPPGTNRGSRHNPRTHATLSSTARSRSLSSDCVLFVKFGKRRNEMGVAVRVSQGDEGFSSGATADGRRQSRIGCTTGAHT